MAVVLCSGFDESLYSTARIEGDIDRSTAIVTLRKGDLPLSLAAIVERASNLEMDGEGQLLSDSSGDDNQRYVIFSGSRSALDAVMKGFKKAYKPAAGSVIFAMLTDTAKLWTLEKYLAELVKEHQEMRNYQATASMLHEKDSAQKR